MNKKGDSYYTRPYQLNPRVRELLDKKIGNKGLSYMKIENIVTSVMNGKYKETLTKFTDEDKVKLMNMFQQSFSTNLLKENIDVIVKFLTDNFTEDEIKNYADYVLEKYKPGMVYQGIRVSNHSVIYLLEALGTYPFMKGIIINKKYINDLIPFFDKEATDFNFDENTLLVETDYTGDMYEIFEGISIDTDVRFHNDDEIFIIATFDDEVAKNMKESFKGLVVQSIPIHKFDFKNQVDVDYTSVFITEEETNINDNLKNEN